MTLADLSKGLLDPVSILRTIENLPITRADLPRILTAIIAVAITKFLWKGYQHRRRYHNLVRRPPSFSLHQSTSTSHSSISAGRHNSNLTTALKPGPPHSWLFGSIPTLASYRSKFPTDIHPWRILSQVATDHNLRERGLLYIDGWPLGDSLIAVCKPETLTQTELLPKHPYITQSIGRVVGRNSILTAYGAYWKGLRQMFSPGFSHANIMTLLPMIMEECQIFTSKLRGLSQAARKGELPPDDQRVDEGLAFIPSIEELMMALTSDIILGLTLGLKSHCQTRGLQLIKDVVASSKWPYKSWTPLKPFIQSYYEWKVDRELKRLLKARWVWWRAQVVNGAELPEGVLESRDEFFGKEGQRTVVDLAFEEYRKKVEEQDPRLERPLPKQFLEELMHNMKTFIFGGHDTTATILAVYFFELTRNPTVLSALREEHTQIFGPSLTSAPSTILTSPHLLNSLPYTTAVIRELLRLYQPASSARTPVEKEGTTITGTDGKQYPVSGGQIIWLSPLLSRDKEIYPRPNGFHPERFLTAKERASGKYPSTLPPPYSPAVSPMSLPTQATTLPSISQNLEENSKTAAPAMGTTLEDPFPPSIPPAAHRPFERGPRACIGQELALLELKIIAVLITREFHFESGYEELWIRTGKYGITREGGKGVLGEMKGKVEGWWKEKNWVREEDGGVNECYPVLFSAAKPKEGVPVWVGLRE